MIQSVQRLMMSLGVILLCVVVLASGRVTTGSKEEVGHGTPTKHGKQERDKDGHHNVHFDHEAILGSYKLEEEFDDLPPEEAKKRLGLLVKKMDADHDMFVTKKELSDWIMMSYRLLDEEEAIEDMGDNDENSDGRVTWAEYLQSHYTYTQAEIDEMRTKDDDSVLQLLVGIDEEERKFKAADLNNDGALDKDEFVAFYHPYNYEHMHQIEIERVLREHDKNKDGLLSLEEFMGEGSHDDEWQVVEKQRFEEYDTSGDKFLNTDEMKPWVLSDNREEADDEAAHLFQAADSDEDDRLTEREILDAHEEFVGSQATDYGTYLHFVKHKDEL